MGKEDARERYRKELRHPLWQRKRLEVMQRDEFRCQDCWSEQKFLNVHHRRYGRVAWEVPVEHLVTLCEDCHKRTTELLAGIKAVLEDANIGALLQVYGYARALSMRLGGQLDGVATANEAEGIAAAYRDIDGLDIETEATRTKGIIKQERLIEIARAARARRKGES